MSQFSQWPTNWQTGVSQVTAQDFCAKRVAEGMPANLCEQQFRVWQAVTPNKGEKYRRGINGGA